MREVRCNVERWQRRDDSAPSRQISHLVVRQNLDWARLSRAGMRDMISHPCARASIEDYFCRPHILAHLDRARVARALAVRAEKHRDRKSTRLNSSHTVIS